MRRTSGCLWLVAVVLVAGCDRGGRVGAPAPAPVVAVAPPEPAPVPVPVPEPAGPAGLPVAPAPRAVVRPATPPVYYFPTAVGARWVYEERSHGERVAEYTEVVTRVEPAGAGVVVTVGRVEEGGAVAPVARVMVADRRLTPLSGDGGGRALSVLVGRATDLGDSSALQSQIDRVAGEAQAAAAEARARALLDPIDLQPGAAARAGRAERVVVPGGVFTAVPVGAAAPPGGHSADLALRYSGRAWYAPGVGMVRWTVGPGEVVLKSFTPGPP